MDILKTNYWNKYVDKQRNLKYTLFFQEPVKLDPWPAILEIFMIFMVRCS